MIPKKTAKEISDEITAALEAEFNQQIPLLRGFNRKLAKTIGGMYFNFQKLGLSILAQMHPATASLKDIELGLITINPLKLWGELVDIQHKTGQRAQRTVEVSVITIGGTLASGELIVNADTQIVYQVVGDVPLDAPTVQATIKATRVGTIGNVDSGTILYFVNAPDSVEKAVTVIKASSIDGTDPETEAQLRERIRERFLARPQGGAIADYKLWAEEVEGVLNAYPYSGWSGPDVPDGSAGQVFIFVESSVDPNGIPDPIPGPLLQAVRDHIEYDETGIANRRNINAVVRVFPISRTTFDVTINGLSTIGMTTEDIAAAKSVVESGLADFMLSRDPGGQSGYTTLLPRKDIVSNSEVGGVAGRVVASYGGAITGVSISVEGIDQSVYYLQEGEKAKLGNVTWA